MKLDIKLCLKNKLKKIRICVVLYVPAIRMVNAERDVAAAFVEGFFVGFDNSSSLVSCNAMVPTTARSSNLTVHF